MTDWSKVRVGDVDPTPNEDPDEPADCDASSEDNWFCTRVRDHSPPHVAGTGAVVVAVWS